jgi:hypothetical protein
MHGIALPWEYDRRSVRSLRAQCIGEQLQAAQHALEARRALSRHRRFRDADAVLAQRRAAQAYASARSTFTTLTEAERQGAA